MDIVALRIRDDPDIFVFFKDPREFFKGQHFEPSINGQLGELALAQLFRKGIAEIIPRGPVPIMKHDDLIVFRQIHVKLYDLKSVGYGVIYRLHRVGGFIALEAAAPVGDHFFIRRFPRR